MRKWLPWMLGLAIAGAWMFLRNAGEAPRVEVAAAASAPADVAGHSLSAPPSLTESAPATSARREPATTSLPSPSLAVLRGRCVAGESGAALPGCLVELQGWERTGGSSPARRDQVTTGVDGCFVVRAASPEGLRFWFTASHPQSSILSGQFEQLATGQELDLGDLSLRTGTRVSGQVLDQRGQPVADMGVTVNRPEGDRRRLVSAPTMVTAKSAGDGSFVLPDLLEPARWRVEVRGPHALVTPRDLTIGPGQAVARLEIVVERSSAPDALSGVVIDEEGLPAVGVRVLADRADRDGALRSQKPGTTDRDGRFLIRRLHPDDGPVVLMQLPDQETKFVSLDWTGSYAWGTNDIRLRVRRIGEVQLLVVEAATGTPVEDYGLRCFRDPLGGTFELSRELQQSGRHPGGKVEVATARAGRNALIVYPADPELVVSEMMRFVFDERRSVAVRVELQRRTALPVLVVNPGSAPAAGLRVELLRWEGGGPLTLDTRPFAEGGAAWSTASVCTGLTVLDTATTDAHGRATLRGPPSERGLALKLPGPSCTPTLLERVSITPGMAPLRIEVRPPPR